MIQINKSPGERWIELGGGDNPNPSCEVNVDVRPGKRTHFTADFNEPLPIKDGEWDGVFSMFVIEHLSWRKVRAFLGEVRRILKPGGRAVFVTANTEAQVRHIQANPDGWDGRPPFESASCILFGDQDYEANTHRNWMSPAVAAGLFQEAGFESIVIQPYGALATDLVIEAGTPAGEVPIPDADVPDAIKEQNDAMEAVLAQPLPTEPNPAESVPPERLFNRLYFDGGRGGYGGYAGTGYADFPCHEITARHVLARRPESVLELGCGRGYVLKRLEDAGVRCHGFDVSKHCNMTRTCKTVEVWDVTKPWDFFEVGWECSYDLCFSISFFEHVPENKLPVVFAEMKRTCRRGLHGIDSGRLDDGFDRTKVTKRPIQWWRERFDKAGLENHEIVEKRELEAGDLPADYVRGDGKLKVNVGSFTTMHHHGWVNLDAADLGQWAAQQRYSFVRRDVRDGLPFPTGKVDLIFCCHMLEHLTTDEGRRFLRDCRRALNPETGAMRILVPDAELLCGLYDHLGCDPTDPKNYRWEGGLSQFDEINEGCVAATTNAGKLWAMLHHGHAAAYDHDALSALLEETGFVPHAAAFRETSLEPVRQILRETVDMCPSHSLIVDAVPRTSR